MKPIQSSLKKWMKENENFQENYLQIKEKVMNDPKIRQFLVAHPHLTERDINKNLIKLYEYKTQSKQCDKCHSFQSCENMVQGYSPILTVHQQDIHLTYEKCHKRIQFEQTKEDQNLIQSLSMPKEILEATIGEIDNDPERSQAIRELASFLAKAEKNLPAQGIYFHGPFGVGKTYFLGALANKLKEYNFSSMLIYMPEFVREIRDAIKDDSVNEKVEYFKKADVLMFDDIGAEIPSAWFRDEILGAILQYRMMERLPVFFTSNYSMDQLEEQLSKSTRGGIEEVKAGRIMERVKQVSKPVPVYGKNRRNE